MNRSFISTTNLKKILIIFGIIFLILFLILINSQLTEHNNRTSFNLNYDQFNEIESYLQQLRARQLTEKETLITPKQQLTKVRTALMLYLQDNYRLPTELNHLLGDYLLTLPNEPVSNSKRISTELDQQGGWYYNPQQTKKTTDLTTLIEASFKPNLKPTENYDQPFKPYRLLISTDEQQLHLKQGPRIIASYSIGIGAQESPTPIGNFTVKNKFPITGEGREDFGNYWIGIDLWTLGGSYGIHGTNNATPVTEQKSAGCIRMEAEDIKKLYHLIPLQTRITIK
ncbi:L,D-transpeptidase [Natroniella sp. ANB-PHB2]|uniref:L,D-transpeptidase n=1 Tax=Natroniella sp. ANB-PHB2 TaxID=3384444 RepID=UPI0038D4F5F1